jgi:hypothetical protein
MKGFVLFVLTEPSCFDTSTRSLLRERARYARRVLRTYPGGNVDDGATYFLAAIQKGNP